MLGYVPPMRFRMTGPALSVSKKWRHNAVGLGDEYQREAKGEQVGQNDELAYQSDLCWHHIRQ